MALNLPKIERVAAIVAQALRDEKARAQAEQVTRGYSAEDWPMFFHPIDVAHDWFHARHGDDRAFGRLRRVELDRIQQRVRELLQPEVDEFKASRERERVRDEEAYRKWCAEAAPEIEAWRKECES